MSGVFWKFYNVFFSTILKMCEKWKLHNIWTVFGGVMAKPHLDYAKTSTNNQNRVERYLELFNDIYCKNVI